MNQTDSYNISHCI